MAFGIEFKNDRGNGSARMKLAIEVSWTNGPEFPQLVKGGAMGSVRGDIVHAAGMTYPWRENETGWWLDKGEGDWMPLPPMPVGRAYTTGASNGEDLFLVAGRRRGKPLGDCYRLSRSPDGWGWAELPSLIHPRGAPAAAIAKDALVAVGGGSWGQGAFLSEDVERDEMLRLSHQADGWSEIPGCPGGTRANACAAGFSDSIFVFGGVRGRKTPTGQSLSRLRDAWRFDVHSLEWEELAPLPCFGLSGSAAVPLGDRHILIIGGAIPSVEGGGDAVVRYRRDERRRVDVGWYNERVFLYDLVEDTYSTLSEELPNGTHDLRGTISGRTIYAVGGENVDPSTSNTCSFVRVGQIRVD